MRRLWAVLSISLAFLFVVPSVSAFASVHHHTKRLQSYIWAAHQAGKPYIWGGTGPVGFDCSGLVMTSYEKEHLYLPRTTYDMIDSKNTYRISHSRIKKGDLAFFGSGHVELVAGKHMTFGALHTGAPLGWHTENSFWHPTEYRRVKGSGKKL